MKDLLEDASASKYEAIWPYIRNGAVPRSRLIAGTGAQMRSYIFERLFCPVLTSWSIDQQELYDKFYKHDY